MKTLGDSLMIDSMTMDSMIMDSLMIDSLKDSLIDSLNYSKVSTDSKNSLKDSLLIDSLMMLNDSLKDSLLIDSLMMLNDSLKDSLMMLNDSFQFASFPLVSPFHSSSLLPASRN